MITCDPIFPKRLQTYRPTKPLAPNTVATMPLKLDRPPVPLFSDAKLYALLSELYFFVLMYAMPTSPLCGSEISSFQLLGLCYVTCQLELLQVIKCAL